MKRIGVVVFWALCAIFAIPAIAGLVLALIAVVLAVALSLATMLLAGAIAVILCIPIIWLTGTWDGTSAQSLLAKIKAQSKAPVIHQ